jgi:DNA adenine methylase
VDSDAWFVALAERLRYVRVCCGDWRRILGPAPTTCIGTTAVVLDPPYSDMAGRSEQLYAEDSLDVAHDVREWAIANGNDPKLRIVLCGYDGEHAMPPTWECVPWKASGGYGGQRRSGENVNRMRERLWFSPHCLRPSYRLPFDREAAS